METIHIEINTFKHTVQLNQQGNQLLGRIKIEMSRPVKTVTGDFRNEPVIFKQYSNPSIVWRGIGTGKLIVWITETVWRKKYKYFVNASCPIGGHS